MELACGEEIGGDAFEHRGKGRAFARIEALEHILGQAFDIGAHPGDDPAALVGQVEDARAAIGRVGLTLDPAGVLQPVDDAGKGDRLDLQPLGVEGLILVGLAVERQQQPRLRAGEAKAAHAFIEQAAQLARIVRESVADVGTHAWAYNKQAYHLQAGWRRAVKRASTGGMTLHADLFFSFRSPYSYLAIGRYRALAEEHDLTIALRTVLPIAIRDPSLLFTGNPNVGRYIFNDAARSAQMLGIPYRWPRPDPVVQNLATREIAADQPHIHRLCRLGQAAERAGRGLAFAHEVAAVIWSGTVDNWHEGNHLAEAAARAGLDFAALEAEAAGEAAALDKEIEANQAALEAAGHWGVPTLVFEGEPFFGQDRIAMAHWRMEQKGLVRRDA